MYGAKTKSLYDGGAAKAASSPFPGY
jgi:hypothetical protein